VQTGNKVLIVDDEEDFREPMAKTIRHRGIPTETANGCAEALEKLAAEQFYVIIMDVSMPGVDGIQCLGMVKEKWPSSEVIILTGHASVSSGIEGMEKGAFDYCLKPIDTAELIEKIELAYEKVRINLESC
jgi:DNA-binding NtrC family response regulator